MKAEAVGRNSWFPWLWHRETVRREIHGQIAKLKKTAENIRADHGLDKLVDDIEETRAQGQAAMEEEDVEDEQEGEPRRRSTA